MAFFTDIEKKLEGFSNGNYFFSNQKATTSPTVTKPSAYQANLSTPVQEDKMTSLKALGNIYVTSKTNRDAAQQMYNDYAYLQTRPTSFCYAPYAQETNKAVKAIQAYGMDTSVMDNDWFETNKEWQNYLVYGGTTNSPTKPTQKSAKEAGVSFEMQDLAYQINQYAMAQETTNKANQEWAAMMDEITYWAKRDDLNLSDDQIIAKVNKDKKKKYPTLYSMDESLKPGGKLLELNTPIDYSESNMYGVIWAARNDKTSGSVVWDTASYAAGEGKLWEENKDISSKLDFLSDDFSPYAVGMTAEEEGVYFNRKTFDQQWVDEHKDYAISEDLTKRTKYHNVCEEEKYTQSVEAAVAELNADIEDLLQIYDNPEDILDSIKETKYYKVLAELDDTMADGPDYLKKTTRPINYRWKDVEDRVRKEVYDKNTKDTIANVYDALVPNASQNDVAMAMYKMGFRDPQIVKIDFNNVKTVTPAVAAFGTPAEKNAALTGGTKLFDAAVDEINKATANYEEAYNVSLNDDIKTTYLPSLRDVYKYESVEKERADIQEQYNKFEAEWASLDARNRNFYKQTNLTEDEAKRIQGLMNSEDWAYYNDIISNYKKLEARAPELINDGMRQEYEQAITLLYQTIGGPQAYGVTDFDGIISPKGEDYWEAISNAENILPLSFEEQQRYDMLNKQREEITQQLAKYDTWLEENKQAYNDAYWQKDHVLRTLADANEGDTSVLSTIDYMYELGQNYVPTERLPYNSYDEAVRLENMSKDESILYAAYNTTSALQEANRLEAYLANLSSIGIQFSNEEINDIQRRIDTLKREAKDSGYVVLDKASDFEEAAAKGKEKALNADLKEQPGTIAYSIATDGSIPYAATGMPVKDKYQVSLVKAMTDQEKKRFFYLLETDGREAAEEYFNTLIDEDYGVLVTRAFQKTQEWAENYASQNLFTAVVGSAMSLGTKVLGGPESILYEVSQWIRGKEINPYAPEFMDQAATGSLRQGAKKYMGDNPVFTLLYDAFMSAADSQINAGLMDDMFQKGAEILGETKLFKTISGWAEGIEQTGGWRWASIKATKDFTHAVGMGLDAAAGAYRDTIVRGGTETQAMQMALATFFAEAGSEAVTVGNIHEAFEKGADAAAKNLKEFLVTFAKEGAEEFVGEGFNEWLEQNADRCIMGALSEYDIRVKELTDSGYPESVARQIADQETWGNILKAAAMGFVSSGFGTTYNYAAGTVSRSNERLNGVLSNAVANAMNQQNEQKAPAITQEDVNAQMAEAASTQTDVNASATQENENAPSANINLNAEEAANNSALNTLNPEQRRKKDLLGLRSAFSADSQGATVAITTALTTDDVKVAKAAAQNMVGTVANNDATLAAKTNHALMLAARGLDAVGVKNDIAAAALTNGEGRAALERAFAKTKEGKSLTAADVKAIQRGVANDRVNNAAFDVAVRDAVTENRVANRAVEIMVENGSAEAIKGAKTKVATAKKNAQQKQKNLETAKDLLDKAEGEREVAGQKVAESINNQNEDAANKETRGPVEQSLNQLNGADTKVVEQAEKSVENAQEAVDEAEAEVEKAQKELDETSENAVVQARAEASAQVGEEVQQETHDEAVQNFPPTRAFSRSYEVQTSDGGTVRITGVYDVTDNTVIYTTEDGTLVAEDVSPDTIDGTTVIAGNRGLVNATDLNESEIQQQIDWFLESNSRRPRNKPVQYLAKSVPATVNGQQVQIVGVNGVRTVDGYSDPVIMDINGNEYNINDDNVVIDGDYVDTVYDAMESRADLPERNDVPDVQTTEANENDYRRDEQAGPEPTAENDTAVQVDAGERDNNGELASEPGQDDRSGDNINVESDTGEGSDGRVEESPPGRIRPDKSRVSERLLDKLLRNRLSKKKASSTRNVTSVGLQEETDPQRFSVDVDKARENNSHKLFVDPQSTEDLESKGAIMLTSKDGKLTVAIGTKGKYEGDIFAVCKAPSSNAAGASATLVIHAIAQGGNKLDCYGGTKQRPGLPDMYAKVGMIPVARVKFNPAFADENWNYERDDHPDVIFWAHNGDSAETVISKYGKSKENGGYHLYSFEELENLPAFNDGQLPDVVDEDGNPLQYGYDIAWRFRDNMLDGKYSENFQAFPDGYVVMHDNVNDTDVTIVGAEFTEDGVNYVTLNGDVIPSTNFTESNDQFNGWVNSHYETPGSTENTTGENQYRRSTPPTPTERQAEKVNVKYSPVEIAKRLAEKLGMGEYIGTRKFGRHPRAAVAYYNRHGNYIASRTRSAGNYEDTIHEIGHGLAAKYGLNDFVTQEMVDNLMQTSLGDFLEQYDPADRSGEAFAEFFWRYLANEQEARDLFGDDFYDLFDQGIRQTDEWDAIQEAREDLQTWVSADANAQIGSVIKNRSDTKRIGLRQRFREAINAIVDNTAAANDFDREVTKLAEEAGVELTAFDKVRAQALWANTAGKQATSILTGAGLTDAYTGARIGPSYADVIADTGFTAKDGNLDLLNRYMLAMHSLDRDRQGKPVFDSHITPESRMDFIADVQRNHPEVAAAAEAHWNFHRQFMQEYMVNTGRLSQDAFDAMNEMYPHYVPTYRVQANDSKATRTGKGKKYQVQEAKGGTQDIYNPIDSWFGMVNTIVSQNALNRAGLAFDNMYHRFEGLGNFAHLVSESESYDQQLDQMDEREQEVQDLVQDLVDSETMDRLIELVRGRTRQSLNTSGNTLKVVRPDGSVAEYEFADLELFKLLAGANNKQSNALLDAIGFFTRGMSALTTGSNPIFSIRNFMRDFQNSVNYGSWASNYASGVFKWLAAAYDVWRGTDEYEDYQALGGGGWTRIDPSRTSSRNELYSETYKGYNTSNVGRTIKYAGKKLWNAITLARLNEVVEQASRFAEYKYGKHDKDTDEGKVEAFLAAQEATVDFNRSGNSGIATILKKLVPFYNASMQGVYRTSRMLTEEERARAPQRFAKTVLNTAFMSALTSGLLLKFLGDDEKEEFEMLSSDLKSKHFYLPNFAPDIFGDAPLIRIPLAQDPLTYAIHGAVTNAMWNGTSEGPVIDLAATAETILDNLNPIGSGTIFAPIFAINANKSWYGSSIVPGYLTRNNKYAPDQYTEETPDLFINASRALHELTGGAISLSPMAIQYLAEQYTGFLGQLVIPAISKDANGSVGGLSSAINAARKRLTSDPLISNDVVSSFYDAADTLSSVVDEVNKGKPLNILRRGLTDEEAAAAYKEAQNLTSKVVNTTKSKINDLYDEIDAINANDTLSDHDKYTLASEKRREISELAVRANEQLAEYMEKYIRGDNLVTRVLSAGAKTNKPTAVDELDTTFKEDENEPYMEMCLSVYNGEAGKDLGGGKEAALPHPDREFTVDEVKYEIPDDEWEEYENIYKKQYQVYLLKNGKRWDAMSSKEQYDLLKAAHRDANKKMKDVYVRKHR